MIIFMQTGSLSLYFSNIERIFFLNEMLLDG